MNYNRIIRKMMIRHISSIVMTLMFLIISSYCWYNYRNIEIYQDYQKENLVVSKPIVFAKLDKVKDNDITKIEGYDFSISNTGLEDEDVKITIVSDLLSDSVSNNYIKYSINNEDIHSLNSDGVIYIDKISESEVRNINLKIWISDTYSGNLNYNGRVIVS